MRPWLVAWGLAVASLGAVRPLAAVAAEVEGFRFRPERFAVGWVYHFEKTDLDGSHPERISIRVAALDRIESFKFHPGAKQTGLVIATLDWTTFSIARLQSYQAFAGGERRLFATIDFDAAAQVAKVEIQGGPRADVAIPLLPWHVYNFDFASLYATLAHRVDPRAPFTVGVADPNLAGDGSDGPIFFYRGAVEVRFVGEERRRGVACQKLAIDGAGLDHRGGFLWIEPATGWPVDAEIALPDNPDWTSLKFRRLGSERMDEARWRAFQEAAFASP